MSKISRRDFMKGVGASALSVAAAGLLSGCSTSECECPEAEVSECPTTTSASGEGRVTGYAGPGDWLGSAPEVSANETKDFDVVVVGSGHSGVQAALAAAEKGAKVAVLEMQAEDVFSWYGEDIGAWNSKFVTEQGWGPYDLGEVVDEFITRGGGRSFPEIVRLYVNNSGETTDHMIEVAKEMGVDPKDYTYDNTKDGYVIIQTNLDYDKLDLNNVNYDTIQAAYRYNYPMTPGTKTWATTIQWMGQYNEEPVQGVAANSVLGHIQQACVDKAKQLGAEWFYGTPAVRLVQNSNGDVTGVIGGSEGNYIQFNASMGVVMAGGDYAGNAEMCWGLLNELQERYERRNGSEIENFFSFMGGRNGSSVKMMCWAGAYVEPSPRGHMQIGGGPSGPWGANSMLWLNADGERFCNEGNITGANTAIARQPEGVIALVTDANYMKGVCASGVEHGGPNAGRPNFVEDMINEIEACPVGEDAEIKGIIVAERMTSTIHKAATLSDLADWFGYSGEAKETFLASIEHYNELCKAGKDSDYGKSAEAMIPVDTAPFIGVKSSQSDGATPMMVTMSGVMTDKRLNVLDHNFKPIKGLYTCGNSLGGRYGTGYSTPCAGNSIGMAVTHGRLAGQFVVEDNK